MNLKAIMIEIREAKSAPGNRAKLTTRIMRQATRCTSVHVQRNMKHFSRVQSSRVAGSGECMSLPEMCAVAAVCPVVHWSGTCMASVVASAVGTDALAMRPRRHLKRKSSLPGTKGCLSVASMPCVAASCKPKVLERSRVPCHKTL